MAQVWLANGLGQPLAVSSKGLALAARRQE